MIWQTEEPFSVGADLQSMMPAFMTGNWAAIDDTVRQFQNTSMRLRYSLVPVVAASQGYAFGGGCEFLMHCDKVVAALETYIGLVEVGVGLLPGGGGCWNLPLRAAQESRGDVLAALKDYFMAIATAKGGHQRAGRPGHRLPEKTDTVVFNVHELLYVAKQKRWPWPKPAIARR